MPRILRPITPAVVVVAMAVVSTLPVLAQAEDLDAYGDEFWSADFGRVTYQENGLTIHRGTVDPGLPPLEAATINSPVFPGDSALTGVDQRAEIQLASGTLVRVDSATDVTFLSLPDPYAEFPDHSILQLAEGTIRVTTRLEEGGEFRIDTPASSVYLIGDGDFRVEVTTSGRTEVVSRGGVAEVVGNGGSALVRGGTRTEVFPASLPDEPWAFNTFVTDSFDRWVEERDAVYRVWDRYHDSAEYSGEAVQALPPEVRPYYHELEHYGDWTYTDEYGYVWYPSETPAGWSPYHDGYWSHGPRGYFWVSHEPWGWAPYHYGSWNWVGGFGWCWTPGGLFSGAWVAWSWGSTHVGWAPLDYWGRPAFASAVHFGYYDSAVWTFVDYLDIERRDYQRHAVRVGDVGDIRDATVVTRAPNVPPRFFAESAEYRHAARRMAQEDRAARLNRVDVKAAPPTSMPDVERRLRARRAGDRTALPPTGPGGTRTDPRSPDAAGRAARPGGPRERAGATRFPGYPRRISTDRQTRRESPERRAAGRAATAPGTATDTRSSSVVPRRTTLPYRGSPRGDGGADTEQRVRDLYRRMANPRPPQSPGSTPQRRVQTERKTGAAAPRENRAPRPQRSSPPSPPRQSTPRSGSSGTRKREDSQPPSRNSGGSRQSGSSGRARGNGGSSGARTDARRPSSSTRPAPSGGRSTSAPRAARGGPQPPRSPAAPRATNRSGSGARAGTQRPAARPAARHAPAPRSVRPAPARSEPKSSGGKSGRRGNKR